MITGAADVTRNTELSRTTTIPVHCHSIIPSSQSVDLQHNNIKLITSTQFIIIFLLEWFDMFLHGRLDEIFWWFHKGKDRNKPLRCMIGNQLSMGEWTCISNQWLAVRNSVSNLQHWAKTKAWMSCQNCDNPTPRQGSMAVVSKTKVDCPKWRLNNSKLRAKLQTVLLNSEWHFRAIRNHTWLNQWISYTNLWCTSVQYKIVNLFRKGGLH